MSCGDPTARDLVVRLDRERVRRNKERIDTLLGLTMTTTGDAADIMYALAEIVLKSLAGESQNIGEGPAEQLLGLYMVHTIEQHEQEIAAIKKKRKTVMADILKSLNSDSDHD